MQSFECDENKTYRGFSLRYSLFEGHLMGYPSANPSLAKTGKILKALRIREKLILRCQHETFLLDKRIIKMVI